MELNKMPSRETVKILLFKRNMTITNLAVKMTELTGQKYTRQSLSSKISRSSLKFDEIEIIAKILNYKVIFEDVNPD